jgi:DNA-binding FadR family transcriptional regulator
MKIIRSSDVVIEFVLDLIIKGEVKPGDKLASSKNLAKKIGTTVISAREAVQSLAAVGLVEISRDKSRQGHLYDGRGSGHRRVT